MRAQGLAFHYETQVLSVWHNAAEMLTDGSKMLAGILEAVRLYSPDGMPVIFDLQLEAEILGCGLVWAPEGPPSVKTHPQFKMQGTIFDA